MSRSGLVLLFFFFVFNETKNVKIYLTKKQLNPWNTIINETNFHQYTSIDQMKSLLDNEIATFYNKIINATNIKKYYLAMEFNKINNPEFNDEKLYSLSMMNNSKRVPLYTPQINNISMHMPSIPVLYKWDSIPKVF